MSFMETQGGKKDTILCSCNVSICMYFLAWNIKYILTQPYLCFFSWSSRKITQFTQIKKIYNNKIIL